MGDKFDTDTDGQMSIEDYYPIQEDRILAISRTLHRAKKQMNLCEKKLLVIALSLITFKESAEESPHMQKFLTASGETVDQFVVKMDKHEVAKALGINSDSRHLSQNLFREIKHIVPNSYVEFAKEDRDRYKSSTLIRDLDIYRDTVSLTFNNQLLPLFTSLEKGQYITLWLQDLLKMKTERGIDFYELLRDKTYETGRTSSRTFPVKELKEYFGIPKTGKGSYMRKNGGFDRTNFEKKVLDAVCEDMKGCRMISLEVNEDGKYYEKVKAGYRTVGYRFNWVFTKFPKTVSAIEAKTINERIDKDPEILKVAKDIVAGKEKPEYKSSKKKNSQTDFIQGTLKDDLDYIELLSTPTYSRMSKEERVEFMKKNGYVWDEGKRDFVKKKRDSE